MAIAQDALAIGLTGPFGSGCTTAAMMLAEREKFERVRLSDLLMEEWRKQHPHKESIRPDLQALGNRIRQDARNPGELMQRAIGRLEADQTTHNRIVFDALRNVGEINALKQRFGYGFFLFALECPASERWERVKPIYERQNRNLVDFGYDNEHDRDDEQPYGQQVDLCVDRADVLLNNDDGVAHAHLRGKLIEYLKLVTGQEPRFARPAEIFMNSAFSAAHGSKCLKRQVGAVLVDAPPGKDGQVVGQGWNENPRGTHPCVEEPRYGAKPGERGKCYRDIVRFESYVALAGRHCPQCGKKLLVPENRLPPWRCAECSINLERFFWPDRAMSLCTAIHAEVAAVLAAGSRAKGTTLYTTTFPCFQCAEKLVQAGVASIVFTEPYPDIRADDRLALADIDLTRFEGVRSSRFDEIFSRARPYASEHE